MSPQTAIVIVLAIGIVAYGYVSHEMAVGAEKQKAASQWGTVFKVAGAIIGA